MKKPEKVLIIGSGAIEIGQAGEFDYSGTQAIKALKEEGIFTILLNPNVASVQTMKGFADRVYFMPLNIDVLEKIIENDKPDSILLNFGGQTSINLGFELFEKGILEKNQVNILGTSIQAIKITESRKNFAEFCQNLGINTSAFIIATRIEDVYLFAKEQGFPFICRKNYSLGGLNSFVIKNETDIKIFFPALFILEKEIFIEESLHGWKEIEYEILRDKFDNCISVCAMENIDPVGIHTGDSIVVTPPQTLNNNEYFKYRNIAINIVRKMGIVGECNVQFALSNNSENYKVIEVNARLSRSSALASKATGYPIAYIAAKLTLGNALYDLKNPVTKVTSAFFEPSLDYLVIKIPVWNFQKFKNMDKKLSTEMKSIGEIMSIGRNFEETFQKAIRMLNNNYNDYFLLKNKKEILDEISEPTDKRIFAIIEAIRRKISINEISKLSGINKWYLAKIKNFIVIEEKIKNFNLLDLPPKILKESKQVGFSDNQIAFLTNSTENEVRNQRKALKIEPFVKQIDTLSGEIPARINYLYLTYNSCFDDIEFEDSNQVVILGSGGYYIGSSVEFDWSCVNSAIRLKELKFKTIMINCNPETVSTDYDICHKLYFEEITFERVLDIYEKEKPLGLIVSFGGQVPNNLSVKLSENVNIFGTKAENIYRAENRELFSRLLDELGINQPHWFSSKDIKKIYKIANNKLYPLVIRSSHILSGSGIKIAINKTELMEALKENVAVFTISKFVESAKQVDFDAVANFGKITYFAVSESIELSGIHSGDCVTVFPAQSLESEVIGNIFQISCKIALYLEIEGIFNIQFLIKGKNIFVLECNLRASRQIPFISQVSGIDFIGISTNVMMNKKFKLSLSPSENIGIKTPKFSLSRLRNSEPLNSFEMSSTGEVACIGNNFKNPFLNSLKAAGFKIPPKAILIISFLPFQNKRLLKESIKLIKKGIKIYTIKLNSIFKKNKIEYFNSKENLENEFLIKEIELVVILTGKNPDEFRIKRKAIDLNIPLIYSLELFQKLGQFL